jgi:para-aminobenzoate synthetase component I
VDEIKKKMLDWVNRFNIFLLLDSRQYQQDKYSNYECLVAAGAREELMADVKDLPNLLQNRKWYFGHLAYEKETAGAPKFPRKENRINFPDLYFFVPQILILLKDLQLEIEAENPESVFQEILSFHEEDISIPVSVKIQGLLSKEEYISKINQLKEHIQRGDCYEINFCQEFFAENAEIDPHRVFSELMKVSPNPFSAFYRLNDKYLLCASPERFLLKKNNRLVSQPIKGTMKRNLLDSSKDEALKMELRESPKEQSENVMVVDLVRNDLSRICEEGSVKVEELFGIYSFPQVHQMISTIAGDLKKDMDFLQILNAVFPMGSMTGAPKHRVMELIDEFETQSRGIFSGSVGYISPEGDFDFNVVIRSIMYNSSNKYLSYQVGSGITFYSNAENEWEECLLKAEAIKKVLAIS